MLNSELIKQKARAYGADLVGIGDISRFDGVQPFQDPRLILPRAKSLIGLALRIPAGTFQGIENRSQFYSLTHFGIKSTAEEMMIILLLKMARVIEDAGYEAVLQRDMPNLRYKDDWGINPEVAKTTTVQDSWPVLPEKPAPDVMIDFRQAAAICGLGRVGRSGSILTKEYGPLQRFSFIITNAPLQADPEMAAGICDDCLACARACPGRAIGSQPDETGRDDYQCSVYYRGAHQSNPFQSADFLIGWPERDQILQGAKRFTREEALQIQAEMDFLPNTRYRYVPCLCGRLCDMACYRHLHPKNNPRRIDE